MNVALRSLPPLAVIVAFAIPVVLLRPRAEPEPELQHSICLELPIAAMRPTPIVELARHDIEGCLAEWNERVPGDVEMLVRLQVNEGNGSAQTESGPNSPSLWLCVSEAIARIDYRGVKEEFLEANVFVLWERAELKLSMAVMQPTREREIDVARRKLEQLRRRQAELEHEIELRRAARHTATNP